MTSSKKSIGIICPEKTSFNYCQRVLSLENEEEIKGRDITYGEIGDYNIFSIYSGTGKIKTAAATQLLIDKYNPDLIIDSGKSTSLADEINMSSIIVGLRVYEYDVFSTAQIEEIPEEYITETDLNNEEIMTEVKEYINSKRDYGNILLGNIACGERKIDNRIFCELLHSKFDSLVSTWESAAALQVAKINNIKRLSLRVVMTKLSPRTGERVSGSQKEGYRKLYNLVKDMIIDKVVGKI